MTPGKLDKRIVIFSLFALPIIGIAFISYIVNSRPIYEGSKASESGNSFRPAATSVPEVQKIACLKPQTDNKTQTVNLFADPSTFATTMPVKVYAVGPTAIQYLSLVEAPYPGSGKPFTSVSEKVLEKGALARFVGLQGNTSDVSQAGSRLEENVRMAARNCQAIVLE